MQHQLVQRGPSLGDHQQAAAGSACRERLLDRPTAGDELLPIGKLLRGARETRPGPVASLVRPHRWAARAGPVLRVVVGSPGVVARSPVVVRRPAVTRSRNVAVRSGGPRGAGPECRMRRRSGAGRPVAARRSLAAHVPAGGPVVVPPGHSRGGQGLPGVHRTAVPRRGVARHGPRRRAVDRGRIPVRHQVAGRVGRGRHQAGRGRPRPRRRAGTGPDPGRPGPPAR